MDGQIIVRVNSTGPILGEIIIQEISQLGLLGEELNLERLMGNQMIILTVWQKAVFMFTIFMRPYFIYLALTMNA